MLAACSSDPTPVADGSGGPGGGNAPACNAADTPAGSAVGEFFPDARVTGCDGTKVTLDALRCQHELTWLSVGASWCGPCQEEAPELQAAHEAYADEGIGVYQILFQGPDANPATTLDCANWTEQYALTLPVYVDPVGNTVIGFDGGATTTPLNVVVDRDGEVIFSHMGALEEGVDAVIQSLR